MAHCSDSTVGNARDDSAVRSELDALMNYMDASLDEQCADELIEWIEAYESSVRFVPDWSDETYKRAA
jgi:hypothetical protein